MAVVVLALAASWGDAKAEAAMPPGFQAATQAVNGSAAEYRIGPNDKLSVTVFQVKDLSLEAVKVDASGQILLPLIGPVAAAGKTTAELSNEIAAKLGDRYLQNPQVSVLVTDAAGQRVTVEGAVEQAGVYEIQGRTTLLQAIALAKGPSKTANMKRVMVYRDFDGTRHGAVFNFADIRDGRAQDPEIRASDIVIMDQSGGKSLWRGIIETLPAIGSLSVLALF